jgi:hypothetical protein
MEPVTCFPLFDSFKFLLRVEEIFTLNEFGIEIYEEKLENKVLYFIATK